VTGAQHPAVQHPAVQRLQFFLLESRWDPAAVNDWRLELLRSDPATAPDEAGVLVIDDSGDRKGGVKTAHVGRQWLGRYDKTDNGVVTATTLWADERIYYPVDAVPYTPARHFAKGKNDPAFLTKMQIGASLAIRAREAGFPFRAVVAECAYCLKSLQASRVVSIGNPRLAGRMLSSSGRTLRNTAPGQHL
jgi:SRSO17 transposase